MSPAGVAGTVANTLLFTLVGRIVFGRPMKRAVAGGLTLAVLHWWLEIWHNLSHDQAARMTGHPMTGIRLGAYGVLGTSLYPADEGDLPARVHITRALGGPAGSVALSVITGLVALVTGPFAFGWIPVDGVPGQPAGLHLGSFCPSRLQRHQHRHLLDEARLGAVSPPVQTPYPLLDCP